MRLQTVKTKKVSVPNDPDKAFVILRLLDDETLAHLEEKFMKYELGETETSIGLQPEGRASAVGGRAIKDWGNFFGVKGKELTCNQVNIRKMSKNSVIIDKDEPPVRFLKWVDEEHTKFRDEDIKERKEATKN